MGLSCPARNRGLVQFLGTFNIEATKLAVPIISDMGRRPMIPAELSSDERDAE